MEAAGVRQALERLQGHLQDKDHGALGAALRNLHSQEEQHLAFMRTWLQEDQRNNELLHQRLKELEEAAELEEAWQQQRQAQGPGAAEARTERALLARRRGFCHWLQALAPPLAGLLQRLRPLPPVLGTGESTAWAPPSWTAPLPVPGEPRGAGLVWGGGEVSVMTSQGAGYPF